MKTSIRIKIKNNFWENFNKILFYEKFTDNDLEYILYICDDFNEPLYRGIPETDRYSFNLAVKSFGQNYFKYLKGFILKPSIKEKNIFGFEKLDVKFKEIQNKLLKKYKNYRLLK